MRKVAECTDKNSKKKILGIAEGAVGGVKLQDFKLDKDGLVVQQNKSGRTCRRMMVRCIKEMAGIGGVKHDENLGEVCSTY
jgi:hypothetical protein